jgi:predicted nucleic acid-binding protein
MEKYDDLPMDLADASLVWLAGELGIIEVITLDETDFGIYRLPGGQRLTNLLTR